MASLISYLVNKGSPPSSYNNATGWLDDFVNNLYLGDQVKWIAGGSSSTLFAALWSDFAVPEIAFVLAGSVLWYTSDSGANWTQVSQTDSTPTGTLAMCFDTTLPTGYLWLDGAAQAIASYSALNTYLNANVSAANLRKQILQTTYTSTSQATFNMVRAITGCANADTINLYWNSGTSSRLGMALSSVSTTSFVASGGTGDSIPNSTTTIFEFSFATTKFLIPDFRNMILVGNTAIGGTSVGTLGSSNVLGIPRLAGTPIVDTAQELQNSTSFQINYRIKT